MPMHQPLTEHARQVLDQAQHEARSLGQEFVGTEHVLLALLKSAGAHAVRILRQQHVDRDALATQLRSALSYSEEPPGVTGALPMSPKMQRALNSALVMSRSQREPKLSTRVLLLSLMEEQGTPFLAALRDTGVDVEQLLRALQEKPTDEEA